jgi:hypothetical protein
MPHNVRFEYIHKSKLIHVYPLFRSLLVTILVPILVGLPSLVMAAFIFRRRLRGLCCRRSVRMDKQDVTRVSKTPVSRIFELRKGRDYVSSWRHTANWLLLNQHKHNRRVQKDYPFANAFL